MTSDLERLLKEQYEAGEVVDEGAFTVDREKALEKIAEYQLPYPEAWVLKLVQGMVLCDVPRLVVHQTGTETRFEFHVDSGFASDFEQAFFEPGSHLRSDFQEFRAGLWSLALSLRRPFRLRLEHGEYFWNGHKLTRSTCLMPPGGCVLEVSHRTMEQGKGLPLLRSIQAAKLNTELLQVLCLSVCTAPMEILVDGRRLDGFHLYPGHGFSKKDLPLKMFWLWGRPELGVPVSNRDNDFTYAGDPKLAVLSIGFEAKPTCHPAYAVAMVSAHAHDTGGRQEHWATEPRESLLLWVRHGVVVQRERFAFPADCLSLAIFVNADDIRTDITGFGLDENATKERLQKVMADLTPLLHDWKPDLSLVDREGNRKKLWAAGGMAATGIGLSFMFPPALLLTLGGYAGAAWVLGGLAQVDTALEKGYNSLMDGWHQASKS